LSVLQCLGLGLAIIGLVYLLAPGVEAPTPIGAGLMILSGIGWGLYSVLGKSAGQALARTAGNFARAAIILGALTPFVFWQIPEVAANSKGLLLAILSGTLTSALGYALWYSVLKGLTVTTASISQLSVPVIAAIGGVLFVFEPVTLPFAISCAVVLLGVGLATIKPFSRSSD